MFLAQAFVMDAWPSDRCRLSKVRRASATKYLCHPMHCKPVRLENLAHLFGVVEVGYRNFTGPELLKDNNLTYKYSKMQIGNMSIFLDKMLAAKGKINKKIKIS